MWTCPKCSRIFQKAKQPHSCQKVPLEKHFKNKDKARKLFDELVKQINAKIGKCTIISLPCCIHLFGNYDFLAALPKKDLLEIRFTMTQKLTSSRIKLNFPLSASSYKICLNLNSGSDIDKELLNWLKTSYHLKDKP